MAQLVLEEVDDAGADVPLHVLLDLLLPVGRDHGWPVHCHGLDIVPHVQPHGLVTLHHGQRLMCTGIECAAIILTDQLKVDTSDVAFNTEVTFSRNAGYELTGTEKITCGANGWSDTNIPTCGGIIIYTL